MISKVNKHVKRHIMENSPLWIIKKCKACLYPGHYGEMELIYVRKDRAAYEQFGTCFFIACIFLLVGIMMGLIITKVV